MGRRHWYLKGKQNNFAALPNKSAALFLSICRISGMCKPACNGAGVRVGHLRSFSFSRYLRLRAGRSPPSSVVLRIQKTIGEQKMSEKSYIISVYDAISKQVVDIVVTEAI